MASDLGIYRAAWELIDQHGEDALERAVDRARELAEHSQDEAALMWLRIAQTVRELERERRPGGVN